MNCTHLPIHWYHCYRTLCSASLRENKYPLANLTYYFRASGLIFLWKLVTTACSFQFNSSPLTPKYTFLFQGLIQGNLTKSKALEVDSDVRRYLELQVRKERVLLPALLVNWVQAVIFVHYCAWLLKEVLKSGVPQCKINFTFIFLPPDNWWRYVFIPPGSVSISLRIQNRILIQHLKSIRIEIRFQVVSWQALKKFLFL